MGSYVWGCSIETLSKAAIKEFCFESRRISFVRERRMETSNIIGTWTRQYRSKWGSLKSNQKTICFEHDWNSSTWHWMAFISPFYSLTESQIFRKKLLSFRWRTWRKRSKSEESEWWWVWRVFRRSTRTSFKG